ncbi:MAG TPA: EAL domain-containing protein [Acetobacteraceae bacterium]|nr:EAL domain-containing protein [Acetobacteraceae bacterium]
MDSIGGGGAPLNILVLSQRPTRDEMVRAALSAGSVGGISLVTSAAEAVLCLVQAPLPFSHLVIDAGAAGPLTDTLRDLVTGDTHAGTGLVIVETPRDGPPEAEALAVRQAFQNAARWPLPPAALTQKELRSALLGNMVCMHYQPVVRLADGAAVALEALARLRYPTLGLLPPRDFVPQAEAAGLSLRLTQAVASSVAIDLASGDMSPTKDMPADGRDGLSVAVNLPLNVLAVPGVLRTLKRLRYEAGLPPERLSIELTESRPVHDLPGLARIIGRLRILGFRVALDDAGPATPNLPALLDLPFSAVKIDQGVTQATTDSAERFLAGLVGTAQRRGFAVIAEGVKDLEIWQRMRRLGVDQAQGFLIARPMPRAAVPIWLAGWPTRWPGAGMPA